jgi:hypothetical protein
MSRLQRVLTVLSAIAVSTAGGAFLITFLGMVLVRVAVQPALGKALMAAGPWLLIGGVPAWVSMAVIAILRDRIEKTTRGH